MARGDVPSRGRVAAPAVARRAGGRGASVCARPVYRTYIGEEGVDPPDAEVLREAGVEWVADGPEDFVRRWQQTTPVMAKGVEDTAFYRYGRLLALNDVGGDPGGSGSASTASHEANRERAEHWPLAMTTLQTHDTKRSADVRARLRRSRGWLTSSWRWPRPCFLLLRTGTRVVLPADGGGGAGGGGPVARVRREIT